ncbi:hypothetical protein V6N13_097503 [Hibiscus sabdariffa]
MAFVRENLGGNRVDWSGFFCRSLRTFEVAMLNDLQACVGNYGLKIEVEDRLVLKHDMVRVPPKIQCFLWFVAMGWLPTLTTLREHGIRIADVDVMCRWCGVGTISVDHLFLQCSVTREVWYMFFCWWNVAMVFPKGVNDFMYQCLHGFFTAELR